MSNIPKGNIAPSLLQLKTTQVITELSEWYKQHYLNSIQSMSLEQLRVELVAWQAETFPVSTVSSKLLHLEEELDEITKAPHDMAEWADGLILFLGAFSKAHPEKTSRDLLEATWAKLGVNKARKWGEPDAHGVVRHLKEDGANPLRGEPRL